MYIIVIRLIWIFYEKIAEEGDNPANNPNICNVTGDNRWSPGVQLLTTGSVLKIGFFFHSVLAFSIPKNILLSSAKQNIQIIKILKLVSV